MPRKPQPPRICACGCKTKTKGGRYLPGHDAKLVSAIIEAVGGLETLRKLAEKRVGRSIEAAEQHE